MISYCGVQVIQGDKEILRHVSLEIKEGERVVVTGPSGSGKSTLLQVLLGVYTPSKGEVLFRGREISPEIIGDIRQEIAYIGQEPFLGAEGVRDALFLPFSYRAHRNRQPSQEQAEEVLNRLKLPAGILKQTASTISGGEKQRIAIARALLLNKQVFLLDEITSALDADSIDAVLQLFDDPQYTVLSVSHEPRWISFCPRKLEMDQGLLVSEAQCGEDSHGSH